MLEEPPTPKRTKKLHTNFLRRESTYKSPDKRPLSAKTNQQTLAREPENLQVSLARFQKLKLAEWLCSILATTGFACGAIAYDASFEERMYEDYESEVNSLLLFCTISTVLLLLAIVWRTHCELAWGQAKGYYSPLENIASAGKLGTLLVELFINAIHPVYIGKMYYIEDYSNTFGSRVEYSYVSFLSVLMIVRVYHLLRLLTVHSSYRSSRSQRLCDINGTYAGTSYALKCLVNEKPHATIIVTLLSGIFVFAYCMRIFERGLKDESGQDFANYENAMWNVIITMTTVGYGDYFPVSIYGRIVGFVACIYGVFVVSLAVVTLMSMLTLEASEEQSLLLLTRLQFKSELREGAARLITALLAYLRLVHNYPEEEERIEFQLAKYRQALNAFSCLKQKERSLYNADCFEERVERKLHGVVDSFTEVQENVTKIRKILDFLEQEE